LELWNVVNGEAIPSGVRHWGPRCEDPELPLNSRVRLSSVPVHTRLSTLLWFGRCSGLLSPSFVARSARYLDKLFFCLVDRLEGPQLKLFTLDIGQPEPLAYFRTRLRALIKVQAPNMCDIGLPLFSRLSRCPHLDDMAHLLFWFRSGQRDVAH